MRTITVSVLDEVIKASSNIAGAAGSYNAVTLEITFSDAWDGLSRKVYFYNAKGGGLVYVLLTPAHLKEGTTNVYQLPIPAEPLAYEGDMTMTIKGYLLNGTEESIVMLTMQKAFKVYASGYADTSAGPAEPTPTQAEQLQAQIDALAAGIADPKGEIRIYEGTRLNESGNPEAIPGAFRLDSTIDDTYLSVTPIQDRAYFRVYKIDPGTGYGLYRDIRIDFGEDVAASDALKFAQKTEPFGWNEEFKIYHEGNKPTPEELGIYAAGTALPATTGAMTATMDGGIKLITPTGNCTFNATGGTLGQRCAFVITTSGTTSYTLTWGTDFKTAGTLATGTADAKKFVVEFIYDGTTWNEVSRTVAM
jgi:hypothetical protein